MSFMEIIMWTTFGCLPAFLVLDTIYKARRFDTPPFWRLRAFVVTVFTFALSFAVPMAWASLLGGWSLLDLSLLGTVGGAVVGILAYQLGHYWYHRTVHRSDRMFRWLHQMHHSAESVDAWGAYYISPFDAAIFISIGTLVLGPGLGVSPMAAGVANLFLTFNAVFQHANIRTPRWLGYIIQRPESHGVHHQRGVHAYNYADLPLWDIVFGTFHNPETFEGEAGYYKGASTRIGEMLLGRDVTEEPVAIEIEIEEPVEGVRAA